jgi:hypothetical protein
VPALVFSSGPAAARRQFFQGRSPLSFFSATQPGAEKRRSGNFETPAAQKRRRHGIQGGRLTTLSPANYEQGISIIYFSAQPALTAQHSF